MKNASYNTIIRFKKLLVIFWGTWWLTALWTDLAGGMAYLGWLQADWAPSKNYPFLVDSLKMYALPSWIPALFFIGIIAWMAVACVLFVMAIKAILQKKPFWHLTHKAFMASMTLWLGFFLADQMIMNYDLEANHMIQGGFQLLCWLFLFVDCHKFQEADNTNW